MGLTEFAPKQLRANMASVTWAGLMEVAAEQRVPVDSFPEIDIPVGF